MKYLLDTHIVLWLAYDSKKITENVKMILSNKHIPVYFSSINILEIAIKLKTGKLEYSNVNVKSLYRHLLENNYQELTVNSKQCFELATLPLLHNDPFDRILISQAMSENLTLITHDSKILNYDGVKTLKT